jgi:hypothetical protein
MSVGEIDMKEGISMTRMKYSVSKEGIKDDECGCGWCYTIAGAACLGAGAFFSLVCRRPAAR